MWHIIPSSFPVKWWGKVCGNLRWQRTQKPYAVWSLYICPSLHPDQKNKLLFCYLIEVLCCIVTLSPVNIKIVKLHLCQKQIKSWVNMYCCQGAMSRSSVPQKDEHSKTSPRWGSEKSHCFLLSKYKCLQRIDQCVQKLSTTTSSSMITVWACSCTKIS